MRLLLHQMLIGTVVFATVLPVAWADNSDVTAQITPPLKAIPVQPDKGSENLGCPIALCGIQIPPDLWKHDAPWKAKDSYMNEAAILVDRDRREALDERFIATPPIKMMIGNSKCYISLSVFLVVRFERSL